MEEEETNWRWKKTNEEKDRGGKREFQGLCGRAVHGARLSPATTTTTTIGYGLGMMVGSKSGHTDRESVARLNESACSQSLSTANNTPLSYNEERRITQCSQVFRHVTKCKNNYPSIFHSVSSLAQFCRRKQLFVLIDNNTSNCLSEKLCQNRATFPKLVIRSKLMNYYNN